MLRIATIEELNVDEIDELGCITEIRAVQAERRLTRTELLIGGHERVHVGARIHLLEPDHELQLRKQLVSFEDRLAVLRYCRERDDAPVVDSIEFARERRNSIAALLTEGLRAIDVVIGRPPAFSGDWSLSDLSVAAIDDDVDRRSALRDDIVRAVDHIADSGLLRVTATRHRTRDGVAHFELTEHDAESVAQVSAFAAEVTRLGRAADLLTERLRSVALRSRHSRPKEWMLQNALRRRAARDSLDRIRAVHGALDELRRACEQ